MYLILILHKVIQMIYFGKIEDVGKLLNSFNELDTLAKKDYEYVIKRNIELKSIHIEEIDYRFLKIRADGIPAYKPNLGLEIQRFVDT